MGSFLGLAPYDQVMWVARQRLHQGTSKVQAGDGRGKLEEFGDLVIGDLVIEAQEGKEIYLPWPQP